ncbi:lysin B [Mycobacterium phage KayaCho]|uniref:lysin B n=1 Tax=Mycobacterium phage KayaCho TaxID=1340830 RepID=UPI000387FCCF|nr:lysin B [Mycobacterium phage KayaCho]AGT12946.1 lysin B [Mycobacterium phage KayaCho]
MSLALGSSGLMTAAWTAMMRLRYPSYALGRDGNPIKVDGYFGYDEEGVAAQYQSRTGQLPTGHVSDRDLHQLGLLPTLISTHGSGQPDPFGIGYPADIARRLLHLYWWQPTGNYPATSVPMRDSADQGYREILRFLGDPVIVPGDAAFVDYSQGSICGGRARNDIRAGKIIRPKGSAPVKLLGGVTLGNPMRPEGAYAGNVDPGGSGLDPTLETASEPGMLHLAHPGDIYTAWEDDGSKEMARAVFNGVFLRFTGRDSIIEQFMELLSGNPLEILWAGRAILRGGMFVIKGTGPHVQYHTQQCPGTGQTYYEHGVTHLERLATARLEAIVARGRAA